VAISFIINHLKQKIEDAVDAIVGEVVKTFCNSVIANQVTGAAPPSIFP
jgi:hypothetical protein